MINSQMQTETVGAPIVGAQNRTPARSAPTLKTSTQYLKGVGPQRHKVLARVGLFSIGDIFYFFPKRYENRQPIKFISELILNEKACVSGLIESRGLIRTRGGQSIFRVVVTDGKKSLFVSSFNHPYLLKVFLPKSQVILYGIVEKEGKNFHMI